MSLTIVTHVQRLTPSTSQITDSYEMSHYWEVMLRFWKLPPHINHFPGANPMSIEHKDFARLESDDFLAALKTDGVRHLLLLTTKPNSIDPIAIMIDRAKKMHEIEVWANDTFFYDGSLYDGELVWDNDSLVYVVFDVIAAKGVSCNRLSYRERIQILYNTILCAGDMHSDDSIEQMIHEENKFLARNNQDNLRIIPKKCVSKSTLRSLWDERISCGHRNDGIIFTLNNAPVETGTSSSILKWKPSHSIDLRLQTLDGSTWRLYGNMNNCGELEDITDNIGDLTPVLEHNKLLDAILERQPCIIECLMRIEGTSLILTPERERTDKVSPNTLKTIEATILNTRENISPEELIKLVQSV